MDEIIDKIYEAALIPDLWPDVLDSLAVVADGVSGILLTNDMNKWIASPNAVEIVRDYIDMGWHAKTERTQRLFAKGLTYPGFVTDLDVFTAKEIENEPVYREFFRPRGWGWGAGTIITAPSGDLLAIDVERPYEKGPVENSTISRLNKLRPHLARSALLAGRFSLEKLRSSNEVLDIIGLPAIALAKNGYPLAINKSFECLLDKAFFIKKNKLSLSSPNADSLLNDAINRVDSKIIGIGVNSIPIPGTHFHSPMILHIIPIKGAASDIFVQASTLLVVTQLAKQSSPTTEILQGLFDLTPAEARLARAVSSGQTVNDYAVSLSLSRETIRTQLKSILSKTGVNRQTDLAILLTGLALTSSQNSI